MKRMIALFLCFVIMSALGVSTNAADIMPFDVEAKSALLMDAATGRVLYSKNCNEALPPASVTKIMTLLLIMEEIDSGRLSLSDTLSVSEYAASMGGSQVFLEAGEEMKVEDLLKSVIIASANDAAVTFAEAISGSEEAFVKKMNERAAALGMKNTSFENVTGLDDDTVNHTTSAYDIALMSRELICAHPTVLKYSSIWMDTIRDGEFGLTNTNRLIRFYKGATGLKTGSTSKAGFCISATAERDGMHLIAVIMGSETRDKRNEAAKKLLDHGFATYCIYSTERTEGDMVRVEKGVFDRVKTEILPYAGLVEKSDAENVEIITEYKDKIKAPVKKGTVVGTAKIVSDGREIGRVDIVAAEEIEALSFTKILYLLFKGWLLS